MDGVRFAIDAGRSFSAASRRLKSRPTPQSSTGSDDRRAACWRRVGAAVLVLIALAGARRAGVQGGGVIRVSVTLAGADGTLLPVPRHALLVSDEPPTATPRRIVTALDGTASIRLTPGTYTVESDQPVAFQGREYQWRQTLAVVAGQDVRAGTDHRQRRGRADHRGLGRAGRQDLGRDRRDHALAGQRRRPVDADAARLRLRDRRARAGGDEPAGGRRLVVGRGADQPGGQGERARAGRRPRERRRRAVDRSGGDRRRSSRCRSAAARRRRRRSPTGRRWSRSACLPAGRPASPSAPSPG